MTRKQMKENARAQLQFKLFGNNWLYAVLVIVIMSVILSIIPGIGTILLTGPISYGVYSLFLKQSYDGETMNIGDMFNGFKDDLGENILLGLMITIFTALWSILFIIPGIVMSLAYSMSYFVKADHPEYGWKECMDESKRLMKGHKLELFILELSFIGWFFVGSLCFGVGNFWVMAYSYATITQFYRYISAPQTGFVNNNNF